MYQNFEVFVRVGTDSSDLRLGSYVYSNEFSGSIKGWEFFDFGRGFSSSQMGGLGYGNLCMGVAELAYFRWWFYVSKVKTAETRVSHCHIIISHSRGWKSNQWYLWWCCQTDSFHGPGWESSQEYFERRPATLNSTWKTTVGCRSQGDVQYVLLGKF